MARKSSRVASGPRFPAVVDAYLEDVQVGLQAADEMARHGALQRKLNPYHVAHLRQFFGKRLLTAIDQPSVVKYAMRREASSAAPSVVNEELWDLGHLLRFAVQRGWLQQCPEIWFLPTPAPPPAVRVEARSLHDAVDRLGRLAAKDMTKERGRQEREQRPARSPGTTPKLTDEILSELLTTHPLEPGKPRNTPWRVEWLKKEKGIEITDNGLNRRITAFLKKVDEQP